MGFFDDVKEAAAEIVTQSKERHVKVTVVSGKQCFYLGPFKNYVVIRQNERGFIYFDDIDGEYKILGYEWGGPEYKSITETSGKDITKSNVKTSGREKRTGRVAGAIVGGMVFGPAGAAIGALTGSGNKKTKGREKTRSVTTNNGQTESYEKEMDSIAYMTLKDPKTKYTFSFSFKCNSKIHGEIINLLHVSSLQE